MRSASSPSRTGGGCRGTAPGCSDPSRTARTPPPTRRVAAPLGRVSLGFPAGGVAAWRGPGANRRNAAPNGPGPPRQRRPPPAAGGDPPPACGSPAEDAIVAKFVRAWESADLGALAALLTDDVFISMPPMPFEYEGRDLFARFCASLFSAGHTFALVPTRANCQPAFGAYLRASNGISHGMGLYVLTLTCDRLCAMTRFEKTVLPWFALPPS